TFDHDMFLRDADDARSVLHAANYQLTRDGSAVAVQSVSYEQAGRTAVLTFDALDAGHYQLKVLTSLQSAEGLNLAEAYTTQFLAVTDLASFVTFQFSNARSNRAQGTVSYDITITNRSTHSLL